MKNVLVGESGHILLSFRSQWSQVDQNLYPEKNPYSSPELCHSLGQPMWKIHPSCDFWSLGAILFELFTGQVRFHIHKELETFSRIF
jgi:serine/threonine protein kinase